MIASAGKDFKTKLIISLTTLEIIHIVDLLEFLAYCMFKIEYILYIFASLSCPALHSPLFSSPSFLFPFFFSFYVISTNGEKIYRVFESKLFIFIKFWYTNNLITLK